MAETPSEAAKVRAARAILDWLDSLSDEERAVLDEQVARDRKERAA